MVCPGTTHTSVGITGVDHSWCAMKQECCYGSFSSLSPPFRSSLACYCYKHRRAGLHSRADPSIQWILPLCSNFFFFFSSHTSPIVKLILCPHKLLLWTRTVFLTYLTLRITLSTWQASASTRLTSYSCFHCISEKQEAPVYQHHTSFRASYKAHQKAIWIFPLVLVGFSYKLHSFQGTTHPYTSPTMVRIMGFIGYPVKTLHYIWRFKHLYFPQSYRVVWRSSSKVSTVLTCQLVCLGIFLKKYFLKICVCNKVGGHVLKAYY